MPVPIDADVTASLRACGALGGAAGLLAAAAAGFILRRAAAAGEIAADPTAAVYRRQLAEIDELAAGGHLAEAERRGVHAEAARRLLDAADAAGPAWSGAVGSGRGVLLAVLAAAALALGLYVTVGQPGRGDQPFARRLAAWRAADPAELSPSQVAAVLQRLTRERPDDAEAFRFLALARGASDDLAGAVRALQSATKLAPARADLWELLGEAQVAAARGELTPEAEHAFGEAVRRDPHAFAARFHLSRARIAEGDRAGGVADWRALLAEMPADDPRRASLQQAIVQAEGPTAPAKSENLPADQLSMISGKVNGLAQRLARDPQDAEGWVKLVGTYALLGDAAKRDQALASARTRFAGQPQVLAQLAAAARAEPVR